MILGSSHIVVIGFAQGHGSHYLDCTDCDGDRTGRSALAVLVMLESLDRGRGFDRRGCSEVPHLDLVCLISLGSLLFLDMLGSAVTISDLINDNGVCRILYNCCCAARVGDKDELENSFRFFHLNF